MVSLDEKIDDLAIEILTILAMRKKKSVVTKEAVFRYAVYKLDKITDYETNIFEAAEDTISRLSAVENVDTLFGIKHDYIMISGEEVNPNMKLDGTAFSAFYFRIRNYLMDMQLEPSQMPTIQQFEKTQKYVDNKLKDESIPNKEERVADITANIFRIYGCEVKERLDGSKLTLLINRNSSESRFAA